MAVVRKSRWSENAPEPMSRKKKSHLTDESGEPTFPEVPNFDVDTAANDAHSVGIETNPVGDKTVSKTAAATKTDFAPPIPVTANGFQIFDDAPEPPVRKRGGDRKEKFPFSQLAVGQAFMIEPTEDKPEPWKTYYGTVSSASLRFATVEGTKERKVKDKESGVVSTKTVPNYVYSRRFTIYPVKGEDGRTVAFVKRVA